jgi:hypothetical protein
MKITRFKKSKQLFISLSYLKDCTAIKTFIFLGAITTIGDNAFKGCTSLITITLPSSLITFGTNVFQGKSFFISDDSRLLMRT